MSEKKEMKAVKKVCSKKNMLKGLVALTVLSMMAYGLVYAPMKQLEVSQGNLLINNQSIQLAEAKDVKKCQSLAEQQLALSVEEAEKSGTEVSEDDKKNFVESIYLNCLSFEARDYMVQQIVDAQKEAAAAEADTETTEN